MVTCHVVNHVREEWLETFHMLPVSPLYTNPMCIYMCPHVPHMCPGPLCIHVHVGMSPHVPHMCPGPLCIHVHVGMCPHVYYFRPLVNELDWIVFSMFLTSLFPMACRIDGYIALLTHHFISFITAVENNTRSTAIVPEGFCIALTAGVDLVNATLSSNDSIQHNVSVSCTNLVHCSC